MKNKNKKILLKTYLVAIFFSIFFAGIFLKNVETVLAALTPEQQAIADRINNDASIIPSFNGVNTGNTDNASAVLNNDTRLHSYPSNTLPVVSTPQPLPSTKQFDYKLLESFPGFFSKGQVMNDFPAMILAIYKFGIWTIGIAGFFMLVVGGFMYMTSAGNTSSAGSAKGIVIDALIGIAAALGAYLFLYVINPELTKMNISFTTVDVTETEGTPMGVAGVCQALPSGDCSVANLTGAFGQKAAEASSICNGESGGRSIPSSVDICADGNPASWGLFQINITAHSIGGYDCKKAFSGGAYTAKNHACKVVDKQLYDNCVNAAKNATSNIQAAKLIYNNTSWKPWGANKRSNCNFK